MNKQLIEIDAKHLKKNDKVFCTETRKIKVVDDVHHFTDGVGVKYEDKYGY